MSRTAEITRSTGETEISLSLDLDGTGQGLAVVLENCDVTGVAQ